MSNKETEVRFLEIPAEDIKRKLASIGAVDHGEVMLEEVIIYDKDLTWLTERRFLRIRKSGDSTRLTYKHHNNQDKGESHEIEFDIEDLDKAAALLTEIGYAPYRRQQKKRHTFKKGNVTFDIDTWPKIPTYIEIEGHSLEEIRSAAESLGFEWSKAVYKDARWVIENVYKVPVGTMKWFTFDRFE